MIDSQIKQIERIMSGGEEDTKSSLSSREGPEGAPIPIG